MGGRQVPGRLDGEQLDVSVYGRDASDAQLLAKTSRFLLYRDSGPTLTFTRRQQVEHEAYLTLMADRAGVRVARVLAAGPAGPAKDALLVTRPPAGRLLSALTPYVLPPDRRRGEPRATGTRDAVDASTSRPVATASRRTATRRRRRSTAGPRRGLGNRSTEATTRPIHRPPTRH